MTRASVGLAFCLCYAGLSLVESAVASAQVPIYQALPQRPAYSAYQQAFGTQFYGGMGNYGFGPYGMGGYGFGSYGGYGPYGFGARGYYPPNPFGTNWLPPNPPSPYYVAPSGRQYLDAAQRRDQATYTDLILQHGRQN